MASPKLRISNAPRPYTRRDIMAVYYPELLEQAEKCFNKMAELQKEVVTMLSNSQKQIPDPSSVIANNLQKMQVQQDLMEYIYLKSLYGFAEKICEIIDRQCRSLAEAENKADQEEIDKLIESLENTLAIASSVKIDEPIKGMIYLDTIIPADFIVLKCWKFRDIIGTVKNNGITHSLWENVRNDVIPTDSNIKSLLDDNEMLRIY